jgi:hypothetical protein
MISTLGHPAAQSAVILKVAKITERNLHSNKLYELGVKIGHKNYDFPHKTNVSNPQQTTLCSTEQNLRCYNTAATLLQINRFVAY